MKRASIVMTFFILYFPSLGLAFNNSEEYFNSYHNQPAWFEVLEDGSARGETTGGEVFTQKYVGNNQNLRLQKFVIGKTYFYISDKGIIRAKDDLSAISIYFTLV